MRYNLHRLHLLKHDLFFQKCELQNIFRPAHLDTIREFSEQQYHSESKKCKTRQKKKFEKLLNRMDEGLRSYLPNRCVVNRSSKMVSTPEKSFLSKGMNFVSAPCKSNIPEIIAEIEGALNKCKVNSNTATDIRTRLVGVLNKPIQTHKNLSSAEGKVLKELRKDKNIIILPTDKRRSTVVMDMKEYNEKMLSMVSDDKTYKCIKNDPSHALQSRMNSLLLTLVKKGVTSELIPTPL